MWDQVPLTPGAAHPALRPSTATHWLLHALQRGYGVAEVQGFGVRTVERYRWAEKDGTQCGMPAVLLCTESSSSAFQSARQHPRFLAHRLRFPVTYTRMSFYRSYQELQAPALAGATWHCTAAVPTGCGRLQPGQARQPWTRCSVTPNPLRGARAARTLTASPPC